MKTARFHPQAENEMIEAAEYYESRQKDLGKRFLESVRSLINQIRINPKIFKKIDGDIRCAQTAIFPYGIIYRERNACLEIIAVMHLKRKPGYWQTRTKL